MPAGRPLKFKNVKEMREKIDAFFADCIKEQETPTISGLAYALDICTDTLRNYQLKDEYFATIKRAKQLVEISWEKHLLHGGSGAIFWLKNNAGWKDKTETDNTHHVEVTEIERRIIDSASD